MSDREIALPCDCVGVCSILVVAEWDEFENDPEQFMLDFYTKASTKEPLKERLKLALKIITKKDHALEGIVLYREKAQELRLFLNAALDHHSPTNSLIVSRELLAEIVSALRGFKSQQERARIRTEISKLLWETDAAASS